MTEKMICTILESQTIDISISNIIKLLDPSATCIKVFESNRDYSSFIFEREPILNDSSNSSKKEVFCFLPFLCIEVSFITSSNFNRKEALLLEISETFSFGVYSSDKDFLLHSLLNYSLMSSGYGKKIEEIPREQLISNILYLSGMGKFDSKINATRILDGFK